MDKRAIEIISQLARTRTAITQGKFSTLDKLAEVTEAMSLPTDLDADDLIAVKAAAKRTMAVIEAAKRGIADSIADRNDAKKQRENFASYGSDGQFAKHIPTAPQIIRKA